MELLKRFDESLKIKAKAEINNLILLQEETLVKTDDIIDSLPKLMGTRRIWIRYFDGEAKIRNAPERSFFGKLAKKKALVIGSKASKKWFDEIIKSTSHFYFDTANSVLFNMASIAPFAHLKELVAFLKTDSFYETLNVLYMRASLDEPRKQFIIQRLSDC